MCSVGIMLPFRAMKFQHCIHAYMKIGRCREKACSLVVIRASVALEVLGSILHESEYFDI